MSGDSETLEISKEPESLVIIGSGPAAYTAAIYAARANLRPLVYAGFYSGPAGGQLMTTTEVENYPGFPEGITGPELMEAMVKQAQRFGTRIIYEDVEEVDLSEPLKVVRGPKGALFCKSLIIATGANAKKLPVPGADRLWQMGVTACAICDGANPIFRDQPLFVIGGGDSAMEEALFLTRYASHVYIVHRRGELRASRIMAERAQNHPKITILWHSQVAAVEGEECVERVQIHDMQNGSTKSYKAAGLFFAVGHEPNTAFLKGQLSLKENGYIQVQEGSCRTNIAGVFAAGDVTDHIYRQAITAAGMGCMAAIECERWLSEMESA